MLKLSIILPFSTTIIDMVNLLCGYYARINNNQLLVHYVDGNTTITQTTQVITLLKLQKLAKFEYIYNSVKSHDDHFLYMRRKVNEDLRDRKSRHSRRTRGVKQIVNWIRFNQWRWQSEEDNTIFYDKNDFETTYYAINPNVNVLSSSYDDDEDDNDQRIKYISDILTIQNFTRSHTNICGMDGATRS